MRVERWSLQMAEAGAEGEGSGAGQTPAPGVSETTPEPMALDWRSSLPEDLRGDVSLRGFRDVAGLAKSYINTKAMVGDRVKVVPGWDTGEMHEEAVNFRKKVGVPDSPDGYEVELLALPEGHTWDGELLAEAKKIAHKHAVTPAQYKAFLDLHATWLQGIVNKAAAAKVEQHKVAQEAMGKLWGAAKQFKVDRAQRAFVRLTNTEQGQRLWDKVEASGMGNDPDFLEWVGNMQDYLPEDTYIGDGGQGSMPLTMDGLGQKINEQRKKVFDLAARGGEEYFAAQRDLNKLYQQQEELQRRNQNRRFVA